ncbi:MAG: hypothetical protein ACK56F_26035, partial [bacterium]
TFMNSIFHFTLMCVESFSRIVPGLRLLQRWLTADNQALHQPAHQLTSLAADDIVTITPRM